MEIAIRTPLIHSLPLSQLSGSNVWLKMESAQPTGSFKLRSAGHICQYYAAQGAKAFVSSSGGNAGIAVAHSGRRLGLPVTVVVPETTPARARQLIEQEGARLIVHGSVWSEANAYALSLASQEHIYIHPFDNPLLWDGISTLVDEVIDEGLRPDAVILSVGGGSLLSGIAQGLEKHQLSHIPIYAVETEGTASLNAALEAGERVTLDRVSGIATTLAASQVCENAFNVARRADVRGKVVSDDEAVNACRRFLDDHRVLTEPACGVSLSMLYDGKIGFKSDDNVLVIVCGGASVTLESLQS
ncbi:pyridoxal-phosphate dependent enzyme [Pantoea sp. B550]|uniref:pyridoxal-phosphate dependent enzyme n=1 Tax=Pantoea TaxID=53335 RepID=UPI001379093F|nr:MULTISPECIES: pyridoxal-phosphate dependent enzyme [Pantoea]MCP1207962.1 pyridoxal-phosphate dependent enzyme [Pantoea sp. B550]MCT2417240.1 pyridoxal-phosphate dependent enzyme [Pantoea sp. XY16]NBB54089.1 pyridoxal-phosphate dependent enzyme [Pantoea vagans]QZX94110.1 pyridoxal-phosphate dependent enzyme [Pantoea alfalfae]WIL40407.1 pyridoxal-phosphate dependent enzyme [Pantoea agglomerans]